MTYSIRKILPKLDFNNPFISIGISETLARGFSWLTFAVLPLFLQPNIYGNISLAYSTLLALSPFILIGQDREILASEKSNTKKETLNSLLTCFIIGLLATCLFLIFLYFSSNLENHYSLLPLIAFCISANKIHLSFYRAESSFFAYAKNRVFYTVSRFLLITSSLAIQPSIFFYLLAESISAMLASLGLLKLIKKTKLIDFKIIRRINRGLPIALHGISAILLALSDRFVLAKYLGTSAVGHYSFMYTFASALTFGYAVIATIYEPAIYRSESWFDLQLKARKCIVRMFLFGAILSVLLSFAYYLISSNLKEYPPDSASFSLLLASYIIMPIYLVANYILIRIDKSRFLFFSSGSAFIINLILNFALIPNYHIIGAAIATLISNIFLVIFTTISALNLQPSFKWESKN